VLLSTPEFAAPIAAAGVSAGQVRGALEPSAYLGAAGAFVTAALAAHDERESATDGTDGAREEEVR
jgi:hypothetical protein